jgi:hypothetical protein
MTGVQFAIGAVKKIFHFATAFISAVGGGGQQASYSMGIGGCFPGLRRPECEADHLPPNSAEVKNTWSYASTTPIVFMAWCFIKHSDNLTVD